MRSDGEQDRLAGKDLFGSFPGLRGALSGAPVVALGSMPEAAEVRGRPDAERVVGARLERDGKVIGLYASGWSWSAYAYRLENAARSTARSALEEGAKMPLIYVYVIVGREVYGAPVSPDVNVKAVRDLDVVTKIHGAEPFATELEITGREFGIAALRAPALGDGIAVSVLRSET